MKKLPPQRIIFPSTTFVARGRECPLEMDDEAFGPLPRTQVEMKMASEAYRREVANRCVREFYRKKPMPKIKIIYGTRGGMPVYENPTEKRDAFLIYIGMVYPVMLLLACTTLGLWPGWWIASISSPFISAILSKKL